MKAPVPPLISSAGPEFELLCLAGRVGFDAHEARRIQGLAATVSWKSLLAAVERNYVAPLVYRNLKSIGAPGIIPQKVLETLRVRSKITAIKSELFTAELVRLVELFESKSIQTINYKGAATAAEYYGSVSLRNFNDLDFLVRRSDVAALCEILETDGYRNSEPMTRRQVEHHIEQFKEFLYQRGEICLEPHWSLAGRRYPFEMDYEGFWERSRTIALRGTTVRVMSGEDSLLVLCLVGAKGRWKRLQMVTDVEACVRNFPNLDWGRIEAMSRATGTRRILHLGLLLAADLAGAKLPAEIDREVRGTGVVRRLATDIVQSLSVKPRPRRYLPDSPATFSLLLFRQRERLRDRWHYLWHTTTTPTQTHLTRLPLPGGAFPLYRVFVPLNDFVMYPMWQVTKSLFSASRTL